VTRSGVRTIYWKIRTGRHRLLWELPALPLQGARRSWLRSLVLALKLAESLGFYLQWLSLNIEYRRPPKLDDELVTTCDRAAAGSPASVCAADFRGADRPRRVVVEASVRVACIDARTLRPEALPDF